MSFNIDDWVRGYAATPSRWRGIFYDRPGKVVDLKEETYRVVFLIRSASRADMLLPLWCDTGDIRLGTLTDEEMYRWLLATMEAS